MLDEQASIVAHQYFGALAYPDSPCAAVERVLPQCRGSWNRQEELDALEALGLDGAPRFRDLDVVTIDGDSAVIRITGTSPEEQIETTWVLDAVSKHWMLDSCGATGN